MISMIVVALFHCVILCKLYLRIARSPAVIHLNYLLSFHAVSSFWMLTDNALYATALSNNLGLSC